VRELKAEVFREVKGVGGFLQNVEKANRHLQKQQVKKDN